MKITGFSPDRVARTTLDAHDRGRLYVLPQLDAMIGGGLITLERPDQALPTLVGALMPTGLRGIVVAGLLAAVLAAVGDRGAAEVEGVAGAVAHHREGAGHPHRRTAGRDVARLDHEHARCVVVGSAGDLSRALALVGYEDEDD